VNGYSLWGIDYFDNLIHFRGIATNDYFDIPHIFGIAWSE
jgi:hypothetical protein